MSPPDTPTDTTKPKPTGGISSELESTEAVLQSTEAVLLLLVVVVGDKVKSIPYD